MVAGDLGRFQATNVSYLTGVTSRFEMPDTECQLLDSDIALSHTTRAVHQSDVQIYRALDGLWQA